MAGAYSDPLQLELVEEGLEGGGGLSQRGEAGGENALETRGQVRLPPHLPQAEHALLTAHQLDGQTHARARTHARTHAHTHVREHQTMMLFVCEIDIKKQDYFLSSSHFCDPVEKYFFQYKYLCPHDIYSVLITAFEGYHLRCHFESKGNINKK